MVAVGTPGGGGFGGIVPGMPRPLHGRQRNWSCGKECGSLAGSDLLGGPAGGEGCPVREGVKEKGLGERAEAVGLAGGLGLYLPPPRLFRVQGDNDRLWRGGQGSHREEEADL